MVTFDIKAEKKSLSVSEYISRLNRTLSTQGGRVKGEVVNIKIVGSSAYYTIKDSEQNAKLDCATWLNVYQANGIDLQVGDEIIITGTPEYYAPYGRFNFRATAIEYAGEGDLKRAFEKLKAELEAEGLLDTARKRPLPLLPKKIGIITSMSSGVVIHDFSSNLDRHGYKITTCDSKVEGKEAVLDILAAIRAMSKQDIELLVIIRGGGSPESFQAFNTESVVRAVAEFNVPVITGIGHDVDVTLTQLVADFGASTPTAVAATLNAQWEGLRSEIEAAESNTLGHFRNLLREKSRQIDDMSRIVIRGYDMQVTAAREIISSASLKATSLFRNLANRVNAANAGLQAALGTMRTTLRTKRVHLSKAPSKLTTTIDTNLMQVNRRITGTGVRLAANQSQVVNASKRRLKDYERLVSVNDPARNLRLGYSLSYIGGKLARQLADVKVGDMLSTTLADGDLISEVKELK
jgi:exodeoxyribonuclease VII large subunit